MLDRILQAMEANNDYRQAPVPEGFCVLGALLSGELRAQPPLTRRQRIRNRVRKVTGWPWLIRPRNAWKHCDCER